MARQYTGVITKEGEWYVARCLELDVTTQGRTLELAHANLQEAAELYVESFGDDDIPASTSGVTIWPVVAGAAAGVGRAGPD